MNLSTRTAVGVRGILNLVLTLLLTKKCKILIIEKGKALSKVMFVNFYLNDQPLAFCQKTQKINITMHQLWSEKTCCCYCCCCCRRRYCLVLLFVPLLLSLLMVFQSFSIVVAVVFVVVVVDVVVSVFDTYTLIRDCYSPMGHKEAPIYHTKACCVRLPWALGIFSHFES